MLAPLASKSRETIASSRFACTRKSDHLASSPASAGRGRTDASTGGRGKWPVGARRPRTRGRDGACVCDHAVRDGVDRAPSDPGRDELEIRVARDEMLREWGGARFAFVGGVVQKGPIACRHVEFNNDAWARFVGHCSVPPGR